jgi:hypothetical protein
MRDRIKRSTVLLNHESRARLKTGCCLHKWQARVAPTLPSWSIGFGWRDNTGLDRICIPREAAPAAC